MKLSIVSWNVRGLNCRRRRGLVINLLSIWKADVVCLQESKLEGDISNTVKEIWEVDGLAMFNWTPVVQRGGGWWCSDHMGQKILGGGT